MVIPLSRHRKQNRRQKSHPSRRLDFVPKLFHATPYVISYVTPVGVTYRLTENIRFGPKLLSGK